MGRQSENPVCRLMDYSKRHYDQRRKKRLNKQTKTRLKEIKLRPVDDIGDYKIKIKKMIEFLEAGHRSEGDDSLSRSRNDAGFR